LHFQYLHLLALKILQLLSNKLRLQFKELKHNLQRLNSLLNNQRNQLLESNLRQLLANNQLQLLRNNI
jgi:hypothetical protein